MEKKRGRPPLGELAMTSLERNRKYKARLKASGALSIQIVLTKTVIEVADMYLSPNTPTRTSVIQDWIESLAIDAALAGESNYGKTLADRISEESIQLIQEI